MKQHKEILVQNSLKKADEALKAAEEKVIMNLYGNRIKTICLLI